MRNHLRKAVDLSLAIAINTTFLGFPAIAETNKYPSEVKEQIVQDCVAQPLPFAFSQEFRQVIQPRYCTCYASYLEENLLYEDFQVIDSSIRQDPQSIRRLTPKYLKIFETAFTSCYQRTCDLPSECRPLVR